MEEARTASALTSGTRLDGRVVEVRRKPPQIVMPDDRLTDREDANFRNF
jgi:hypothetical protein